MALSCGIAEAPPWSGTKIVDDEHGAAAAYSESAVLEHLMLGYQRADRQAATALVQRLSPPLLRFLAGPLQTRPHAEDMLQECWLRIHKARHTYRPGAPVLPWVFAIARHTRVDAYRRLRRIDAKETTLEQTGDPGSRPPEFAQGTGIDLWRLVEQLPAGQREVIRMLKVSGMSLEEVARATGCSVGAVKQKAHRAYGKLRALLRDHPLEPRARR